MKEETWVLPVWTESFSVGNEALDGQHKHLLELCKRAVESLSNGDVRRNAVDARHILDELAEYVRLHFRAEEIWMQNHAYPGFERHREAHSLYEMKLESLMSDAEHGVLQVNELILYLADWWTQHILEMDRDYASCAVGESS